VGGHYWAEGIKIVNGYIAHIWKKEAQGLSFSIVIQVNWANVFFDNIAKKHGRFGKEQIHVD